MQLSSLMVEDGGKCRYCVKLDGFNDEKMHKLQDQVEVSKESKSGSTKREPEDNKENQILNTLSRKREVTLKV